jgi:tRNA(Ile)-lysidine synthase
VSGPAKPDGSGREIANVLRRVRAGGLLRGMDRCVVLVSGGRDSVCLLDVVVTLCGSTGVVVLHVNYGLRGAESRADERHVRQLADRARVACVTRRAGPPPARGNLQAWARDIRYGEASSLALERDALIATGHTASDQLETILYRLAASPGRRALLGMAPRDGRLIRPLLDVTREDTAAYCRARGLSWRDDATNSDERFARGRVRHGLIEQLRTVHPAAEANVLRSAALLREEAAVLDEVVGTALGGRSRIAIEALGRLPAALARLVVVRLAEEAGGTLLPGVGARVGELRALAAGGGSAELDIGGGVRAIVEYGVLRFERREAAVAALGEVALPLPGRAGFGAWKLESELRPLTAEQAIACLHADGSVGVLDADLLADGALTVRAWRAGDRLRPIGLRGAKTLADLFAARRVPRADRASIPIVVCADEILWVPGVATAERVRVGSATERVAVLTARRGP